MMSECRECGAGNRFNGAVVAYGGRYTITLTPEQVETFDLALMPDGTMKVGWSEGRRSGIRRADGVWLETKEDCEMEARRIVAENTSPVEHLQRKWQQMEYKAADPNGTAQVPAYSKCECGGPDSGDCNCG